MGVRLWQFENVNDTIPTDSSDSTRRQFLEHLGRLGVLASGVTAAVSTTGCQSPFFQRRPLSETVRRENEKAGTRDWLLSKVSIEAPSKYRSPAIEGYTSHASIRPGETILFHVSARPATYFNLEIFRLGFYGGLGGRRVTEFPRLRADSQVDPVEGSSRLRDCQWPITARWEVPKDAVSGVYLGKMTTETDGYQSYLIFVVRDDRHADLLVQCSDHTWQAYNRWPSQYSLYDDGKSQWYWGGGVKIGFNRPYGMYCQAFNDYRQTVGAGEFLLFEFPLTYWLEKEGYDVSYISNTDTHSDPKGLLRAKGLLSVGHDEYWTIEMFRNVQHAIQAGLNVAFFSGNAVCGRIEYSPDSARRPNRVFERVGVFGPPGGTHEFDSMSTIRHERPYANELIGAHSTGPVTGGGDWACAIPEHWIFAGTGMKLGDSIPGLVGWEWHGDPAPIPGLEVVATGPTFSAPDKPNGGKFTATIYPGPKGNFVFNAATIWWPIGLSEPPEFRRPAVYINPQGPDPRVQQITRNLLDRMCR